MSKEAMKLALEALGLLVEERSSEAMDDGYKAIKALEEALAKQEQGEPVVWFREEDEEKIYYATKAWDDCLPLYTTPQPKQEQGEPVAYIRDVIEGLYENGDPISVEAAELIDKLYTTTQQRKPLTDEQKQKLIGNYFAEEWAQEAAKGLLHDYEIIATAPQGSDK